MDGHCIVIFRIGCLESFQIRGNQSLQLFGVLGGVLGIVGGKILGKGIKAAVRGLGKAFGGVRGQEGFLTHNFENGLIYGRVFGNEAGLIVPGNADFVARHTIIYEMYLATRRLSGPAAELAEQRFKNPFFLFACHGANSGAGQKMANALDRPIVAFHGELSPGGRSNEMGYVLRRLEQLGGLEEIYGHADWSIFYPQGMEVG